ncbi:MAG: alanine dehydrogenase [Candidatus Geothermarchaeales archaeon]
METIMLTGEDVKKLLTMDEALEAVETAFREKGLGRVQMPPKSYIFFKRYHGDLRPMPAYIEALNKAGVKIVGAYPENPKRFNLPLVMGTMILVDPDTGHPFSIMDACWLTAMRTGAGGGVAAKYLSRKNARTLGIIGAGMQARTQFMAIDMVRSIERVYVNDIIPEKAQKYAEEMGKSCGADFIPVEDPSKAVRGVDVLVTATPTTKPIVRNEWVEPGLHINAIGADAPGKQELDFEVLKRAKIVVDDWEQSSHAGEINVALSRGIITKDHVYGELGEVVAGKKPGRTSDDEITIFDSTGLSIQDVATATKVYENALKKDLGLKVDLCEYVIRDVG